MTVRSLFSCNNLPFEVTVADYSVTAVVNGPGPPSANDMLPLLRSALFSPLIQSLREIDRASNLEVDVVPIGLVYGSTIVSFIARNEWSGLTSDLEGVDVSWNVCSGRCLRHFGSQRRLSVGV